MKITVCTLIATFWGRKQLEVVGQKSLSKYFSLATYIGNQPTASRRILSANSVLV